MRISPISFGITTQATERNTTVGNNDFVPTTVRHNSLADMEFNIIADTIRCQNLKNQMNVRLMNLRRNLNNCMVNDIYKR
jgi:hypothetical protein